MIKVKKHGILLYPTELNFENQSVANPACIEANSENKFETNDKP
jgi:hypothetical protein